eukprot:7465926-Prorocentrum_lima.AAC.1
MSGTGLGDTTGPLDQYDISVANAWERGLNNNGQGKQLMNHRATDQLPTSPAGPDPLSHHPLAPTA